MSSSWSMAGAGAGMDDAAIDAALRDALTRHRLKDAVDAVAGASGRGRREVYQLALARRDASEDAP